MKTLKLGALVLAAVAAMVPSASTAMAKGGEGATCAQIVNFSVTPGYVLDSPAFTTSYTINNGCVDERMSAAAVDYRNNATGFKTRSVTMLPYGQSSYGSSFRSTPETSYTVTLTVYAPNGKVAATRTATVTTPAALTPAS